MVELGEKLLDQVEKLADLIKKHDMKHAAAVAAVIILLDMAGFTPMEIAGILEVAKFEVLSRARSRS